MKKLTRTVKFILLFAALSVLLCGCLEPIEEEPSAVPVEVPTEKPVEVQPTPTPSPAPASVASSEVRLWCSAGCGYAEALRELAANESGFTLTVYEYVRENELAEAVRAGQADIVVCGSDEASWYSGSLTPISYRTDVLAVNRRALAASGFDLKSFQSFEDLCRAAQVCGKNFFSADSFTRLIYTCMLQCGQVFYADNDIDAGNDSFVEIYNLLAECAYCGGIGTEEAVEAVLSGHTACAVVPLSSLAGRSMTNLTLCPVPKMSDGEPLYACTGVGFAVCGTGDAVAAAVAWLQSAPVSTSLALSAGQVPASCAEVETSDTLEQLLLELGRSRKAHIIDPDEPWLANADSFEAEFRAVVDELR